MQLRTVIYISDSPSSTGTYPERLHSLRQAVEEHGDTVVATYSDHPAQEQGKRRSSGWKTLLRNLDGIEQVTVASAGDLPGRSVRDLLNHLGRLRDCGVSLHVVGEQIDTRTEPAFALLALIAAYRKAKRAEAIKIGLARAATSGQRIGRPPVPSAVRRRIQVALANGAGTRAVARRFAVSPGTVVNLRREMTQRGAAAV